MLFRQLPRHANGAVGALARIGVHDVGSVSLQDFFSLRRDILRHAERHWKSLGCAQHRVGNAGVPAGGVEQNLPCREAAAAAAFGNDAGGGTIFHRAAGVVPFGFAQQSYFRLKRRKMLETEQWGVADALHQPPPWPPNPRDRKSTRL